MENTNLTVRDSEAIGSLSFTSLKKWQIVAECRDFYLLPSSHIHKISHPLLPLVLPYTIDIEESTGITTEFQTIELYLFRLQKQKQQAWLMNITD